MRISCPSQFFKALGLTAALPISASLLMISMGKAQASGRFSLTCYNIEIEGATFSKTAKLIADCRRIDGSINYDTSLNLNDYITNRYGHLGWASNGDFQESCYIPDIYYEGGSVYMEAECGDGKSPENYPNSEINLDEHIANINGKLTYQP